MLPGEYVEPVQCGTSPPLPAATLSEYQLTIAHPDNPAGGGWFTTTGVFFQIKDQALLDAAISESEGGPPPPGQPGWVSREREVMFGGQLLDVESEGNVYPAVGTSSYLYVYVGPYILEFGFYSQHPDFERPIAPIVQGGIINAAYLGTIQQVIAQTFVV